MEIEAGNAGMASILRDSLSCRKSVRAVVLIISALVATNGEAGSSHGDEPQGVATPRTCEAAVNKQPLIIFGTSGNAVALQRPNLQGLKWVPLLGVLPQFAKNPLEVLGQLSQLKDGVIFLGRGIRDWKAPPVVLVTREIVNQLLDREKQHLDFLGREDAAEATFGYIFGRSLPFTDGARWEERRDLLSPLFRAAKLLRDFERMNAIADRFISSELLSKPGEPINFTAFTRTLTFKILLGVLFSTDLTDPNASTEPEQELLNFQEPWDRVLEVLGRRMFGLNMFSISRVNSMIPGTDAFKIRDDVKTLRDIVERFIERRINRRVASPPEQQEMDLLDVILFHDQLKTSKENNAIKIAGLKTPSIERIKESVDEVLMFFFAGYETTALTLQYLVYEMANPEHKEAFDLAKAEVRERSLNPSEFTPSDSPLRQYPVLASWIYETLRFYPAAWVNGRTVLQDMEIEGFRIPRGTNLIFSPYILNRDGTFANPNTFQPGRFLEASSLRGQESPVRFQDVCSFGGGARVCLGRQFSLMESLVIVRSLLERFEGFERVGAPVVLKPNITLGTQDPIYIKAIPSN